MQVYELVEVIDLLSPSLVTIETRLQIQTTGLVRILCRAMTWVLQFRLLLVAMHCCWASWIYVSVHVSVHITCTNTRCRLALRAAAWYFITCALSYHIRKQQQSSIPSKRVILLNSLPSPLLEPYHSPRLPIASPSSRILLPINPSPFPAWFLLMLDFSLPTSRPWTLHVSLTYVAFAAVSYCPAELATLTVSYYRLSIRL